MQISINKKSIFILVLCLTGCASVDNDVKVPQGAYSTHMLFDQKAIHQDTETLSNLTNNPHATIGDKLSYLMPLVEIDQQGFIHPHGIRRKDRNEEDKSPVYLGYDTSRLLLGQFDVLFPGAWNENSKDKQTAAEARNIIVQKVLYLSDCNFDAYTLRGQTYNDGEKLASDSLNTVGTATVGGLSLVTPPAAAGIALTKLIIDSSYNNVQNSFFGGQTVDALFKAMAANRERYKAMITNKLYSQDKKGEISSYDSYPIIQVLGDIRELNRISTLHGALEDIAKLADTQAQVAKVKTDDLNLNQKAENPAKLQNDLDKTLANLTATTTSVANENKKPDPIRKVDAIKSATPTTKTECDCPPVVKQTAPLSPAPSQK